MLRNKILNIKSFIYCVSNDALKILCICFKNLTETCLELKYSYFEPVVSVYKALQKASGKLFLDAVVTGF